MILAANALCVLLFHQRSAENILQDTQRWKEEETQSGIAQNHRTPSSFSYKKYWLWPALGVINFIVYADFQAKNFNEYTVYLMFWL